MTDLINCPDCAEQIQRDARICRYCKCVPRSGEFAASPDRHAPVKSKSRVLLLCSSLVAVVAIGGLFASHNYSTAANSNGTGHATASKSAGQSHGAPADLIDAALNASSANDSPGVDAALNKLATGRQPVIGSTGRANSFNLSGLKFLKAKQYQAAARQFDQAVKSDPSSAKFLSNLGFAEMRNCDLNASLGHLKAAIAADYSRSVAWNDLGMTLANQGEQEKAVNSFLIGYKVSHGKSMEFLQSLGQDNQAVSSAAQETLRRLSIDSVNLSENPSPMPKISNPFVSPSPTPDPHASDEYSRPATPPLEYKPKSPFVSLGKFQRDKADGPGTLNLWRSGEIYKFDVTVEGNNGATGAASGTAQIDNNTFSFTDTGVGSDLDFNTISFRKISDSVFVVTGGHGFCGMNATLEGTYRLARKRGQ